MKRHRRTNDGLLLSITFILLAGCATDDVYFDENMDFGAIQTVAILPFQNLSSEDYASERVRDAFASMLLATGAVYVLPPGEVARGMGATGRILADGPSIEQVQKLAGVLKVDAIITGTVTEYGRVRSGSISANVISVSLQMVEKGSGVVVWSASTSQGGISILDRLVGGGGEPMSAITAKAVNDLLDKMFQ